MSIAGAARRGSCASWPHATLELGDLNHDGKLDSEGRLQPAKTLWDWLDLLIVPVFLAGGAWFLDNSRKVSEARVEADRQRQATLDHYLEAIADMLLKSSFTGPAAVKDAKEVA